MGLQLYFLDTVFWNKLIYILKVSWFKGEIGLLYSDVAKRPLSLKHLEVSSVKPQVFGGKKCEP